MDIQLKKKHWAVRYKYYIIGGAIFTVFLIYLIIASAGPRKLRYDADRIEIAEVKWDKFNEFVDVEGRVDPKLTIIVNSLETGNVARIVAENGDRLKAGDTILVLSNPELVRTIEDERDELAKLHINYQQKEIEMETKTSDLKQKNLETVYNMGRLSKENEVSQEEYKLGVLSKGQYELAEEKYAFEKVKIAMLLEQLQRDSLMNEIQVESMRNDLMREEKRFERSRERLDKLIVRAPANGQLSGVNLMPGRLVTANSSIGELKTDDQFKISTQASEHYYGRVVEGLPAKITYQNEDYPLKVTRTSPEVRDRMFDVDLVFEDKVIENLSLGRSFRVQIQLEQPEDAIVIPKGSFFQVTGGQWIFKVNEAGDRAYKVPISIGRQNPRQYEIISGISPGDRVIITGYDNFGDAEEIILN